MTCRHTPGDLNCSSNGGGWKLEAARSQEQSLDRAEKAHGAALKEITRLEGIIRQFQVATGQTEPPASPDNENFDILDNVEVNGHLVLKAQYPSCAKCAYEGTKIMVYENVSLREAIKWRVIDPHFADPNRPLNTARVAPSPVARFPGNEKGWADAVNYATSVLGAVGDVRCSYKVERDGQPLRCMYARGHQEEHRFSKSNP
jgi:hypothetical protein